MRLRVVVLAVLTAALSVYVPASWDRLLAGALPLDASGGVPRFRLPAARAAAAPALQGAILGIPAPVSAGSLIAGTFDDATGHSSQSHLIYAANSRVWWLFTLTSAADSEGGTNHVIKAFRSSGPDLATATWIAAGDSPAAASGSPNGSLGGGRSLGIAYLNNSPVDVVHADISMAFDGQDGRTGHIRAVVTGTTITWAGWNFFPPPRGRCRGRTRSASPPARRFTPADRSFSRKSTQTRGGRTTRIPARRGSAAFPCRRSSTAR
jgi:hypothetical protein